MKIRSARGIVCIVTGMLLLGACGSATTYDASSPQQVDSTRLGAEGGGSKTPYEHYSFWQDTPNGGKVLCVFAKDGKGGGLACDFAPLHDNAEGAVPAS